MTDLIYLLRPCRSTYINQGGMPRWLKPSFQHGAWVIGPNTRDQLAFSRKRIDVEVPAHRMPPELAAAVNKQPNTASIGTYVNARDLRRLGWPVPEIPTRGLRRSWWLVRNDDGGA